MCVELCSAVLRVQVEISSGEVISLYYTQKKIKTVFSIYVLSNFHLERRMNDFSKLFLCFNSERKRLSEPLTVSACLPAVPAGIIPLKYSTTSVLSWSLASLVRIHFSVSGFGSSSEVSSSCRLCSNLSTTSFGASEVNWRDSITLWGKTRDLYPFPKISKNNDIDKQNEPQKNLTLSCPRPKKIMYMGEKRGNLIQKRREHYEWSATGVMYIALNLKSATGVMHVTLNLKSNNQNGKETKLSNIVKKEPVSYRSLEMHLAVNGQLLIDFPDVWIWLFPTGVLQMKVLWWATTLGSH